MAAAEERPNPELDPTRETGERTQMLEEVEKKTETVPEPEEKWYVKSYKESPTQVRRQAGIQKERAG